MFQDTSVDGLSTVLKKIQTANTSVMPALFVGHGDPMHAVHHDRVSEAWRDIGAALPRPRVILCVSAHWVTVGSRVCVQAHPQTIHDFYGFPDELFAVAYPAPGAPESTQRVMALAPEVMSDEQWGLDHGAWSFLVHMFPSADIPVFQLSLDAHKTAQAHYELAQKLAVLRREGVLIVSSGNLVHNLRELNWNDEVPAPAWAQTFDEWVAGALRDGDHVSLVDFQQHPGSRRAHPTTEHFLPLLYILGVSEPWREAAFQFNAFLELGAISMRSVLFCEAAK